MHSFSNPAGASPATADARATHAPGRRSGLGAASALPPADEDARRRPKPLPSPDEHPGGSPAGGGPLQIGKYLVSPLVRILENGWFASAVSIRSGSGSGTTDRVLRLTRMFRCADEATAHAHAEGLRWIGDAHAPRLAIPH